MIFTKDDHYKSVPLDEQEVCKVEDSGEREPKVPVEDNNGGIVVYEYI